MFQVPRAAIVPKPTECSNLVVPVCASATHIGLSAIRLEPTYMILGESAGILAALSAEHALAVQRVPYEGLLRPRLLAARQRVEAPAPAPPAPPQPFICVGAWDRCIQVSGRDTPKGGWPNRTHSESTCGGACSPLAPGEWLANAGQFTRAGGETVLVARKDTWLKKSEMSSVALPALEKRKAGVGQRIALAAPPQSRQGDYWLVKCAKAGCGLRGVVEPRDASGTLWWDGTFCDT
jgi:hypothetical protein